MTDPYRTPGLYDLEYDDLRSDIAYYVDVAKRRGGPILELGVGNGRIALPVARAGIAVHGLDVSEAMLSDLERKRQDEALGTAERLTWERRDFREIEGPPRYRTVFWPFNTLHHCTHHRDLLDTLAGVRRALLDDGRLFLDCYLPDPKLYGRDPAQRYGHRMFRDPNTGEDIESWEQSGYDPLKQVHSVRYTYRYADGEQAVVELDLRVYYPQELLALLDVAGFEVVEQFAGFDRRPMSVAASKWVMQLRVV